MSNRPLPVSCALYPAVAASFPEWKAHARSEEILKMPATIGDNSKMKLTQAQQKALYFDHFHPILRQQKVVDAAKAELAHLRKLAKAEGIMLRDINYGLR